MMEPRLKFETKSETLERLSGTLSTARILPQVRTSVDEWRSNPDRLLEALGQSSWGNDSLIVRSSARSEDAAEKSLAGHYCSVADVRGRTGLAEAVQVVVESLDDADDQIFVQPMLSDVAIAGVAFGCDPNSGGPYRVVNYDPRGGTASVTAGASNDLETFIHCKGSPIPAPAPMNLVITLLDELEGLFGTDRLDIEFAVMGDEDLYLLQVRPLAIDATTLIPKSSHYDALSDIADKVTRFSQPHPYLLGRKTIFGVMPDWNPAEIIGIRPRPLALSLYRDLVTDSIWAYQRDNYGYRNLRSFPLMVDFHGLPYIDVRVSFNSFVPQSLDEDLATRLVDYYLKELETAPALHDKIEFDIVYSCYTFDLQDRLAALDEHGFNQDDRQRLADSLRNLTNRIVNNRDGLWRRDIERIAELERRQGVVANADLDPVSQLYWLIEDCKRYGTLPFAGLARAGFIAVQMLRSLVAIGILTQAESDAFMASLETVGSRLEKDFRTLDRTAFLARYGHLRPGTYDILSMRYDEAADIYFGTACGVSTASGNGVDHPAFALSLAQLRQVEELLKQHGLEHDALGMFEFIKEAIEGREYAKFVFTKSLSDSLSIIKDLGAAHGFDREECSYLDISVVSELYQGSRAVARVFNESIQAGLMRHTRARSIVLPPLITDQNDVWQFHMPRSDPNFITQGSVSAPVVLDFSDPSALAGAIVLVSSADPGFDWIFARGISGLVTEYGGINSHMAIRAGELGIPAVIGAGPTRFVAWSRADRLHIDCANRTVQILR